MKFSHCHSNVYVVVSDARMAKKTVIKSRDIKNAQTIQILFVSGQSQKKIIYYAKLSEVSLICTYKHIVKTT